MSQDVLKAIAYVFAQDAVEEARELRVLRRRELREELKKIPSGSTLTAAQNAMFDELEALLEEEASDTPEQA